MLVKDKDDIISQIIKEGESLAEISKEPNTSPFLTFYGMYSNENNLPIIVMEYFEGAFTRNDTWG